PVPCPLSPHSCPLTPDSYMTTASAPPPNPIVSSQLRSSPVPRPRLWPAIVLVAVFWCVVGFMKLVTNKTLFPEDVFTQLQHFLVAFYSPMLLALGTLIWWLGFSRFP